MPRIFKVPVKISGEYRGSALAESRAVITNVAHAALAFIKRAVWAETSFPSIIVTYLRLVGRRPVELP
jgi:hypothetical protein